MCQSCTGDALTCDAGGALSCRTLALQGRSCLPCPSGTYQSGECFLAQSTDIELMSSHSCRPNLRLLLVSLPQLEGLHRLGADLVCPRLRRPKRRLRSRISFRHPARDNHSIQQLRHLGRHLSARDGPHSRRVLEPVPSPWVHPHLHLRQRFSGYHG